MELTPFIGRKRELDQLQEEMVGEESRVAHSIRPSPDRENQAFDPLDRDIWRPRSLLGGQPNLIPGSTSLIFTGPV